MKTTYQNELPEGYAGNIVVTFLFEGDIWSWTFRKLGDTLFAYMGEQWVEQACDLDEILKDVEVVEFIIYESDESEEEGWEEVEAVEAEA